MSVTTTKLGAAAVVVPVLTEIGATKLGAAAVVVPVLTEIGATKLGAAAVITIISEFPNPLIYPSGLMFPDLIGLGYDVIRRPKWNTKIASHISGREARVQYFTYPIYEWDLTYDVLRDFPRGTLPSELKRLEGFFESVGGARDAFLFFDPDDNTVTNQLIGLTTGIANYTLIRTYGDISYNAFSTESIGWVDLNFPFNVYLNGILQDPSTYTVLQNTPQIATVGKQILSFLSGNIPSAGQILTIDMSYYFYAHFSEDYLDFEKFADLFWLLRKVTLESVRIGPLIPNPLTTCHP